ncbi:MAG: NlpC/P60 family protein, partial [Thiohalomonadales bacterium]
MYKHVVVFICIILLASCSSAPYYGANNPSIKVAEKRVDLSDTYKIKQILNQQHKDWRYVQHQMGGTSKKGIDCSGLVYRIYRTKFGLDMPRSTEYQSKIGRSIQQDQLRAGDMVFFKTGISTRHVGIYIDKGEFLHVSSSKGVMISNLGNPYWKNAYWKAQRVQ